jgi:hypothetical protein
VIWDALPGDAAGRPAPSVSGMARHPGTTATKLALDPDFRGHWTFFISGLGVHLTAFTLVLPKLATAYLKTEYPTADGASLLTAKIFAFISVLVVAIVFYYICSVLSSERRSPHAYMKLVALSFGYWFFLSVVLFAGWFGFSLIVMLVSVLLAPSSGASVAQSIVSSAGTAIYFGSIIVGSAAFNRPFWSFKWLTAFAVAIAYVFYRAKGNTRTGTAIAISGVESKFVVFALLPPWGGVHNCCSAIGARR